jgi:beta-lactamase regulating signal transducer with metallopeptidase domain
MVADRLVLVLPLLAWIATYLVHSTGLFGGVWLYLRLFPKCGPAWREVLWKGALLGGIVTASVQSAGAVPQPFGELPLSLNSAWWHRLSGSTEAQPAVATHSSADSPPAEIALSPSDEAIWIVETFAGDGPETGREAGSLPQTATAAPITHTAPPREVPAVAGAPSWIARLRLALLAGPLAVACLATLWTLGRCVRQSIVFRRRLAGCQEICEGTARRLLDELCAELPPGRSIRLLSSAHDPEPAAFCLRQWTIVLPRRAERDLAEDELRALLAHEVAHLVRGDVAWLGVWRVVCSCLAFQPLNHVARREWQRAAEWLCDNWAVDRTGSRLALARCLTEVAGWRLGPAACAPSLGATGANGGLSSRIERLIDEAPLTDTESRSLIRRPLAAAGGLMLFGLFCCAPRISLSMPEPAAAPDEPLPAVTAAEPEAPLEIGRDVAFVLQTDRQAPATIRLDTAGPGDFAELDREWTALAAELEALEPLLQRENLTAAERALAARLAQQIAVLKSRHAELGRIREQFSRGAAPNSLQKP